MDLISSRKVGQLARVFGPCIEVMVSLREARSINFIGTEKEPNDESALLKGSVPTDEMTTQGTNKI